MKNISLSSNQMQIYTNSKTEFDINRSIVITPQVLNTLRSLPYEERLSVASALASEMLLGTGEINDLAPEESMVYAILRSYVKQASDRYNSAIG